MLLYYVILNQEPTNKTIIKSNKGHTIEPFLLARSPFDQIMYKRNIKFWFTN